MTSMNITEIGNRIRRRRVSMEITQEFLAHHLNITTPYICNIERGRCCPSLYTLIRIADVLECSIDYFIYSEYTFHEHSDAASEQEILYRQLSERIMTCDYAKRERILKLIELLTH